MDRWSRRQFLQGTLALAGSSLLSGCGILPPQAAKVHRVGFLIGSPRSAIAARTEAFQQGLRDLGYTEGKDIVIEWRSWEGVLDRLRALAAELVHLGVDVIVAGGSGDAFAAREATATIPIVVILGGAPVESGLVASLARPGGNITVLASFRPELNGKRLEYLKAIVPGLSRVAVFASPTGADYEEVKKVIDLHAGLLGVRPQYLDILSPTDLERAFQAAVTGRADAILVTLPTPFMSSQRPQIAELAVKSRLPAIYEAAEDTEAGGLMCYGVSATDLFRRAATYVDKILKGDKPADLPIEQPTKLDLVINLKTAQAMGLTIPQSVLLQATEIIR